MGKQGKKIKIIRAVTVAKSCCFFREAMQEMNRKGFEMVVISSPGPLLDTIKNEDGIKTVALPMARHISLFRDVVSLIRMIMVFLKEKPDMVHSMTPKAGLVCMMAAWICRVPLRVHTFTGLVWPTEKGIKRFILKTTDRLTCICATHIIPEGQGVMMDLRNGNITHKQMKVLGYGNVMGVDMQRFDPMRMKDPRKTDDAFTFLYVGRLVGDKGIHELVEAFEKLHSLYERTKLVLVGRYEERLDPLDEKTSSLIRTAEYIHAKGQKENDELIQEYKNADCFVMPSYREGFPNTVLEAGAMGLPSIVTDINGSREIVENGKNGLIVPPRDAASLYEAMKYMVENDDARRSMANCARQMIVDRFEKSFVQKCLYDFYAEILSSVKK